MASKVSASPSTMKYIVDQIKYVCQTYTKRAPGTKSERDAQRYFKKELEQWADSVEIEDFDVHPAAFMGWIPFAGVTTIFSVILFWLTGVTSSVFLPIVATIITVFFTSCFVFEFLLYRRYIDFLFPKKVSKNVMARRSPSGEVKRRIIFGGHSDAAYEWTYSYYGQIKTLAPVMLGAIGGLLVITAFNVIWLLQRLFTGSFVMSGIWKAIGIFELALIPFCILICFFINWRRIVDGANDNLTACYISMAVIKDMAEKDERFENTEVCCLIAGSEEAGLRGSLAYAERHKKELQEVETIFIAMDTMNEIEVLEVYTQGQTGTVRDSEAVGELLTEAGHNCGIDMPRTGLYPGAIDSEAFTRNGLTAAGFCGVNHNPKTYYHTRKDSWDNINPECIELSLNICKESARLFDEHGGLADYEEKAKNLSNKKK